MSLLRELKAERTRRLKIVADRLNQTAAAWAAERASVNPERLCAGEIANMLEGLTPSGKDKRGRKVAFVERGTDVLGGERRGISRPPGRISHGS